MELKNWTELERGRAAELARTVGVSQPTMARWVAGEEIPLERCQQIEQSTGGQVTCEEMRPDKVEYFAYMRNRITPDAANQTASTAESMQKVAGCDTQPSGAVCTITPVMQLAKGVV